MAAKDEELQPTHFVTNSTAPLFSGSSSSSLAPLCDLPRYTLLIASTAASQITEACEMLCVSQFFERATKGYVLLSDVAPLAFTRYVRVRECALFESAEHALVQRSALVGNYVHAQLQRDEQVATIESLKSGEILHVVSTRGMRGYLNAYLTGKNSHREKLQFQQPLQLEHQKSVKQVSMKQNSMKQMSLKHDPMKQGSVKQKPMKQESVQPEFLHEQQKVPLEHGKQRVELGKVQILELGQQELQKDQTLEQQELKLEQVHKFQQEQEQLEDQVLGQELEQQGLQLRQERPFSGHSSRAKKQRTANQQAEITHSKLLQFDAQSNTYQFQFSSIGIVHSCFKDKNGTPRQGNLVPHSRARLELTIPHAEHALEGLEQFTHVWILFVFHKNSAVRNGDQPPKVRPPRLGGEKVGLFATRTPHRPNPIGLTVARIESIVKNVVHLSAVDLVDGTPILDIKPYCPFYDCLTTPPAMAVPQQQHNSVLTPKWIEEAPKPRIPLEHIEFDLEAEQCLRSLVPTLHFFHSYEDVKQAIVEVIQTDPRPTYVKKTKKERLYGFRLDNINVRCQFDQDDKVKVVVVEKWEE